MNLFSFIKNLLFKLEYTEQNIKTGFKFTPKELREILAISKKENLKYFEAVAKIPNIKYFDISYLLSQVNLDENKIELIKKAQKIYDDKQFSANGQTQSDFLFRVAANLEYLNEDNIDIFKELVMCKNELYDFKNALKNPLENITKKESDIKFAFITVYGEN